jgi:hypothetical protein
MEEISYDSTYTETQAERSTAVIAVWTVALALLGAYFTLAMFGE